MRALLFLILVVGFANTIARATERPFDPALRRRQVEFEKILQENPTSAATHRAYAEFLSDSGNLRGAIVHWRKAQDLDPGDAATANSLGGACLRAGNAAEAAEQFTRAVTLARDNPAYHFNLANVEFMLRHDLKTAWNVDTPELIEHALAEFRTASRLSPNDVEYARAYAETFYGVPNPDWAAAEAAWRHVLSLSGPTDFAYIQLARISLKRGNANEARRCLAKLTDTRCASLKRKLLEQADRL
jgi:tetratricopeptide (TPR) repeat protein